MVPDTVPEPDQCWNTAAVKHLMVLKRYTLSFVVGRRQQDELHEGDAVHRELCHRHGICAKRLQQSQPNASTCSCCVLGIGNLWCAEQAHLGNFAHDEMRIGEALQLSYDCVAVTHQICRTKGSDQALAFVWYWCNAVARFVLIGANCVDQDANAKLQP